MQARRLGWISALLGICLLTATAGAEDRCKITIDAQLPVKMDGLRAVVTANINGTDAQFIVDTGSFFDFMTRAAAAEFGLPLREAPPDYIVVGVGGREIPRVVTVKTFKVAGVSVHDAMFLVGNNDFRGSTVGLLGQNFFRLEDIDYDFANGALRFSRAEHCRGDEVAYWAGTQPVSAVDLNWTSPQRPHLIGRVAINGHAMEALFDTGSPRTILSLDAAKRAGVTPKSPGVTAAGFTSGMGSDAIRVWIAPIDKLAIGSETIEHTHVLMGGNGLEDIGADMLIGADFFLAHHVYVAYRQEKLYFTYNGGRVFDFNTPHPAQAASTAKTGADNAHSGSPPASNASQTSAATEPAPRPQTDGSETGAAPQASAIVASAMPADAAGYMRRGMAHTSRHEYSQAIADLTRACSLEPADANCRYRRGLAYWYDAQPKPALADFNAAIQLQPDDFDAHLARGELELRQHPADAQTDFDAVDRLAPQEADLRLHLATLYDSAGEYAGSIHQYDLWIQYHGNDLRRYYALASRCGSEGAANVDVDRALDDCNEAIRALPSQASPDVSATIINFRGMVYLRQGKLDGALTDFGAALKLLPKLASARYARGLVELKKGLSAQAQADLAAAKSQQPDIAKHFASIGLTP